MTFLFSSLDDVNVEADAHSEGGLWTANIYDKNETYTLEVIQS